MRHKPILDDGSDEPQIRYFDANGIQHRIESQDLDLIDGDCQQSPIIKGILVVALAVVLVICVMLVGAVVGLVGRWLFGIRS